MSWSGDLARITEQTRDVRDVAKWLGLVHINCGGAVHIYAIGILLPRPLC